MIGVKYAAVRDEETKSYEVIHVDNGVLMDGISSLAAATAIAQLACLGHIRRADDGVLYLDCDSDDADVETLDEWLDQGTSDDDGPEDGLDNEDIERSIPRAKLDYHEKK